LEAYQAGPCSEALTKLGAIVGTPGYRYMSCFAPSLNYQTTDNYRNSGPSSRLASFRSCPQRLWERYLGRLVIGGGRSSVNRLTLHHVPKHKRIARGQLRFGGVI
jgi:hypothetical protein